MEKMKDNEIDLRLALGVTNQPVETITDRDAGANANSRSRTDAILGHRPLPELVWSTQNGLTIKCGGCTSCVTGKTPCALSDEKCMFEESVKSAVGPTVENDGEVKFVHNKGKGKECMSIPVTGTSEVDEVCPVCHKACLDSFGEHAVHCRELPGFKYRHDLVRDVLFDIFRCAGISAKKEAPVNFLTDPLEGRSTLRPTDILVFGWVGGKHACVDLTGVSLLVGLGSSAFTVGQTALKAASGKVIKHEKACLDNQHVFIPFAFDTFGFLAPEAVDLLSRVQRVMHSNVMTPRSMDVVFKRLSFAIQKGVAAQLVVRLPTISM